MAVVQLRTYQQEAVDFLAASERAILAYPPGTGKTAIGARWLDWLEGFDPAGGPALVVAPLGVLSHWAEELHDWAGFTATLGTGTPKQRAAAREAVSAGGILVLNYEAMRSDVAALVKVGFGAVIFDESHRLKSRGKATFKAAAKLAKRAQYLVLATGTPILNTADELWSSLHMLDAKKYSSFWRWALFHFEVGPQLDARGNIVRAGGRPVLKVGELKPGHAEAIRKALAPLIMQRPIEELLPDLPPVTETYLTVRLSRAERVAYESMLKKKWLELGGAVHVADAAITQSLRLRQLASDWSAFGELGELGAKGKACVEIVNDLAPEQVLVLCAFRSTVDALVRALNVDSTDALPYHGGIEDWRRAGALMEFRAGRARVLVGTIATLGEGIDGLQVARNLVLVDRDWTPARNEQAIGRLRRGGQKSAVNVTHLVAADTIDQRVAQALARKQSVVQAILGTTNQEAG